MLDLFNITIKTTATTTTDKSIFFSEFELPTYQEADFYIKESRDMITLIQAMISTGTLMSLLFLCIF